MNFVVGAYAIQPLFNNLKWYIFSSEDFETRRSALSGVKRPNNEGNEVGGYVGVGA
jgi:hypothetical protein